MAIGSASQKGRGARARSAASKRLADDTEPKTESGTEDSLADPVGNWADRPDSEAYKGIGNLYTLVRTAFQNKQEQIDACTDYWSVYHCAPDDNMSYQGNSQGYVPVVKDSIDARCKRALAQLFPFNQKHVEAVSSDGQDPQTIKALLEHYIRTTGLKQTVRMNLISGDVTGQWNLMLDWTRSERTITKLVKKNPVLPTPNGMPDADGIIDVTEEEEDTEDEEIVTEGPEIVDFATEDLAVIPPTCEKLQKAHAVAVRLRLSKERFKAMVDEGVFILPDGKTMETYFVAPPKDRRNNRALQNTENAGIKTHGTELICEVWMVYSRFNFEDAKPARKRSGIAFFAGQDQVLGLIKNPLWSGKIPIVSESVAQQPGSFFGPSKIEPVKFLQWQLNDFWNMGQDAAMYAMLPIIRADPTLVPQWQQLTFGLAAVWPAPPNALEPIEFPALYERAIELCSSMKAQIWESMDVNAQMMGQMPSGRKNNAMIAQMQANQDMNISDHAARYEEVMLTPLVEILFELDQQYRTTSIAVQQMGELGYKAKIDEVPVQQWGQHYFLRWSGTDYQMSMQRMQNQIAFVNVLKGIPPAMLGGLTLDLAPMAKMGTENMFGVEMAAQILVDNRNQYSVSPEVEDEMMHNMFETPVHEGDDDVRHLQSHMRAASLNGDPAGVYKTHMGAHMMALQKKREMQMSQQMQAPGGGLPGTPGGSAPGVAGVPRPGAIPAPGGPMGGQNPPGLVGPDVIMSPDVAGRG